MWLQDRLSIQGSNCESHLSSPQQTRFPPKLWLFPLLAYTAHACMLLKETESQTVSFPKGASETLLDMIGLLLSPQQTSLCGSVFVRPHVVVHPVYLHTKKERDIANARLNAGSLHGLPRCCRQSYRWIQLSFLITTETEKPIIVVHTISPTDSWFYGTCMPAT